MGDNPHAVAGVVTAVVLCMLVALYFLWQQEGGADE
jgi:hypothetical protein